MLNNIKNIVKNNFKNTDFNLPENHRIIFEKKVKKTLHKKKKGSYPFYKIAASFLILTSLGVYMYQFSKNKNVQKNEFTLDYFSPELAKIENYYIKAISYELEKIDITIDNKQVLDVYFTKLDTLTKQYNTKCAQLSIDTINEKNINALIDNLQLRLQLLLQLKKELKTIKTKKNEVYKI